MPATCSTSPVLPMLEGKHRFRLGIPSYVLPADILPNVKAFAPYVDDFELTLFESESSSLPSPETVAQLVQLAKDNELSYTVHFPLDRQLGSEFFEERMAMQRSILAIMRRMRPLKPFAWVLHLEGLTPPANARERQAWSKRIAALLPDIIARAANPGLICVENLLYPFEWCVELVESFKLGVCIDIGHLLSLGEDVNSHLKRFLPRARIVHLHGMSGGKTHRALDAVPLADLKQYLVNMADFRGILTLELFNLSDISASIKYLGRCLAMPDCS